jgi:hypothetical protein
MRKLTMFKKLMFVFSHLAVIDTLIQKERTAQMEANHKAREHHLNLCLKHQQEGNRSHFAEHNCDYCKLLKKVENVPIGPDVPTPAGPIPNVPKPSSPPKIYKSQDIKLW